jgi:hypothetical protein
MDNNIAPFANSPFQLFSSNEAQIATSKLMNLPSSATEPYFAININKVEKTHHRDNKNTNNNNIT